MSTAEAQPKAPTKLAQPAANDAVRDSWLRRWRWPMMLGGPLLIVAVAAYVVITGGKTEETDNAYVQAARAPISTSIAGRVVEVDVKENQPVKAGQVLFKLDAVDIDADLHQAQAALAGARLQVETLRANYAQQQASVKMAEQTLAYSETEAARQKALVAAGVASRQQQDLAIHNVDTARQQVATARQQLAAAAANLGGVGADIDAHPAVRQARASLEKAQTDLGHTLIKAPEDGVVTRVEQLQPGAYVNASQTLFWLISGQPWVEANFKENQLAKMRVGQPVTIRIDAVGRDLAGHVESFSPGTGQAFSALPAQNATGNWVKVVQRLPVRIAFDKTPPAIASASGLSAKVTVDVRPAHGGAGTAGR